MKIIDWFKTKKTFPEKPQPCPHCGANSVRGWVEKTGWDESFFIEHGDPLCFFGDKKMEAFPLTQREIDCFYYWTEQDKTGAK